MKSDSKDICNTTKTYLKMNGVILNFLFIKEYWKTRIRFFAKILGSTAFNMFRATNQYIRIISEGLCDTEDCSNDAKKNSLKK